MATPARTATDTEARIFPETDVLPRRRPRGARVIAALVHFCRRSVARAPREPVLAQAEKLGPREWGVEKRPACSEQLFRNDSGTVFICRSGATATISMCRHGV